MTIRDVHLDGANGRMPVVTSLPDGEGRFPAVLVISDALGLTSDVRNQVQWLADSGYIAAAPDLYYWGGRATCLFSTVRQVLAREGPVFEDVGTVRSWLVDHPSSTGRIGVIGFCMGGGFALILAGLGGYDASSVNYGDVPKDALELLEQACPIVASFGGRDISLRGAPDRLRAVLDELGVPHDIEVYPDAGHGFMNDHDPGEVPMWAVIAGALSQTDHDPSATEHARRRIEDFFGMHLAT